MDRISKSVVTFYIDSESVYRLGTTLSFCYVRNTGTRNSFLMILNKSTHLLHNSENFPVVESETNDNTYYESQKLISLVWDLSGLVFNTSDRKSRMKVACYLQLCDDIRLN